MEKIISTKNSIVSKTLKIKKESKSQLFVENLKLIKEALCNNFEIDYLMIEDSYFDFVLQNEPQLLKHNYYVVSSTVLSKICDTKTPQGIAGVINFKLCTPKSISGNFVVLENLQDPGNLGTIIRSLSGTSFDTILLINCVNPLSQKVVRSSMGGVFKVKIASFVKTEDFLEFAKENNLNFYSASMEGQNIFEFMPPKYNFGFVIGNEGAGVSKKLKDASKGIISIPMKNSLESLNAGVSCSIIAYTLDNKK